MAKRTRIEAQYADLEIKKKRRLRIGDYESVGLRKGWENEVVSVVDNQIQETQEKLGLKTGAEALAFLAGYRV